MTFRNFWLLLFLLTVSIGLHAEQVRIVLTSNHEPLPYAYVFINGQIYNSTDSLGVISLQETELNKGDTLTFSHIGTEGGSLVYDGETSYAIDLKAHEIEQIVVTSLPPEALGRAITPVQNVNWYEEFSGHVEICFYPEEGAKELYSGVFKFIPIPDRKFQAGNFDFDLCELIPANVSEEIHHDFFRAILKSIVIIQFHPQARMNRGAYIAYNGEMEGQNVYTVTRPFRSDQDNGQLRVYVDQQSRIVKKISFLSYRGQYVFGIDADYTLSPNRSRLYPVMIRSYIKNIATGDMRFECSVSNTTLNVNNQKQYMEHRKKMLKKK